MSPYAWEKFHSAITSLVGHETPRERLLNACLALRTLRPEDLPPEIQDEFVQFRKEISRVEARGDEGTIAATIRAIKDDEVDRLVKQIIGMHDTVMRYMAPSGKVKNAPESIKHVVRITKDWAVCELGCDRADIGRGLDEVINHYIEKHAYKLLHIGTETSLSDDGTPAHTTVAFLGQ